MDTTLTWDDLKLDSRDKKIRDLKFKDFEKLNKTLIRNSNTIVYFPPDDSIEENYVMVLKDRYEGGITHITNLDLYESVARRKSKLSRNMGRCAWIHSIL